MALTSLAERVAAIARKQHNDATEHERRMRDDPEYRAEHERQMHARYLADWDAALAADRVMTERTRAAKERRRISRAIPRRLWAHLDAPNATQALDVVRRFMRADDPRTFLVLAGGVGTGKTLAACWGIDSPYTVQRLHRRSDVDPFYASPEHTEYWADEADGLFVAAMALVRAGTFNEEFWTLAQKADRLVIDDLGTEPQDEKGWSYANLCDLLNFRYDWQRKTIITTNLSMDGFKARYCSLDGGRLLDRLRETGSFAEVTGASLRKGVANG